MTPRLAHALAAAVIVGGAAVPAVALAAGEDPGRAARAERASTKVTIQTENGDFWGQVKSSKPVKCAKERKVIVFKQLGPDPAPKTDLKIASDTASKNGDVYEWNTGNTGRSGGRYYAHVNRTSDCKPDNSRTVRASRTT